MFKLIDDKEEFLDAYGKLLSLRLLTGITRISSPFERDLLGELKKICGPFFVKSFEKMFLDWNGREFSMAVLTGGNWNIRGKLLPGHAALLNLNENNNFNFNWPRELETEISVRSKLYHQKYPNRKLFWSPLLTSIEFNYILNDSILVKGSCLHLNILQLISESKVDADYLIKFYGQFSLNCLGTMLKIGLITKSLTDGTFNINLNFKAEGRELDLYTLTLTEILSTGSRNNGNNGSLTSSSSSSSSCSTPLPSSKYFSNVNQQVQISPIDKSILLQCAVTRILKQLRVLGLSDLFNRLSMLPKLLTRFSPTLQDLVDALKQLHEKEFVKLAFGEGIDDLIDATENDLINLSEDNSKLFIKYLA